MLVKAPRSFMSVETFNDGTKSALEIRESSHIWNEKYWYIETIDQLEQTFIWECLTRIHQVRWYVATIIHLKSHI